MERLNSFFLCGSKKAGGHGKRTEGGGYSINPGADNQNHWFFGWGLQREIAKRLALGAVIFYQTPPVRYGKDETGYTVGAIIDFTENHHLLCSAGSDIHGPNLFSYYVT
jgi:hypothetical protein